MVWIFLMFFFKFVLTIVIWKASLNFAKFVRQ